jgi:Hemerythrin HHE cation binding domain
MKATDILKRDHDALRALFLDYDRCAAGSDVRRELFRTIRRELRMHSLDEEQVYFPALLRSRSRSTRQIVRAGLEWHHTVDELLAHLDHLEPEDAAFDSVVASIGEKVEQHIETEPTLADAARHLSDRTLEQLGSEMLARQDRLAG